MMYDEEFVKPMREELTSIGIKELRTSKEVDKVFNRKEGTALIVVNSVCGCAAGNCRPGVAMALKYKKIPESLYTVFAGQDAEATQRAREYFKGYQPSSPSVALMKNGKVVFMLERHDIEGRRPEEIKADLIKAFDKHC